MLQFILRINNDAGRHQRLKDMHIDLFAAVFTDRLPPVVCAGRKIKIVLNILHRVRDLRVWRLLARRMVDEDLLICAEGPEDIGVLPDRLRLSEEEIAAVLERDMENRKQVLLQHRLEIDQQVSAGNEIKPSERRILKDVVLREHNHRADLMVYDILRALARKVPAQAAHAHVLDDVLSIDTAARKLDRVGVEVRGKDLDVTPDVHLLHDLREEDRDRVRLLTCRTAGDPHADLIRLPPIAHNVRDNSLLQDIKILRVTKE